MSMYPLLIASVIHFTGWPSRSSVEGHEHVHNYDLANNPRPDFLRVPLLTLARNTAFEALVVGNRTLKNLNADQRFFLRWRVALTPGTSDFYHPQGFQMSEAAYLELYIPQRGDEKKNHGDQKPWRLIASFPLNGSAFKSLPLHQRLALELLYRKEARGNDPE